MLIYKDDEYVLLKDWRILIFQGKQLSNCCPR